MNQPEKAGRDLDIVVFGATGFTGGLTAEYLAAHAPADCRWALAGRDPERLRQRRDALAAIDPRCADLPLLHAEAADSAALRALAARTRVVVNTVGPYLAHGEPLVAACAQAGTDYLDATGESEFIDRMYLQHDARARETGARLVHASAFLAVPFDLGVLFTVRQFAAPGPLRVDATVRTNLTGLTSGSLQSGLMLLTRLRHAVGAARRRGQVEPCPRGRRVRTSMAAPTRDRVAGGWTIPAPSFGGLAPLPDAQVVARSAAALADYGPDFRYRRGLGAQRLPKVVGSAAALIVLGVLVQVPAAHRWVSRRIEPGRTPSDEQRARTWFAIRFTATSGDTTVTTEVAGGDPGYDEGAKMLAESALGLAFDDLPVTSGQVTPAEAGGDALIARLRRAGLTFSVLTPVPGTRRHLDGRHGDIKAMSRH